jgi:hypothetical protein
LSNALHGNGVFGQASNGNGSKGVWGRSVNGTGVRGEATGTSGTGVVGIAGSPDGKGVAGYATGSSGATRGVEGQSGSTSGVGVYGRASASSGTTNGVYGRSFSATGYGVTGYSPYVGTRGIGTASNGVGSWGEAQACGTYGRGTGPNGWGIFGEATGTGATKGVFGRVNSTLGAGVYGESSSGAGIGVRGYSSSGTGYGVVGSSFGYAGWFAGKVHVTGNLTKGGGGFLIDHPVEPGARYLEHSFVEAPERLNVYSGTATLDARGSATVRLPRYFEALNSSFRYQLTPIGGAAPSLHVAREVHAGSFRIAGGTPGQKVSWQVTGVRKDAWAQANPLRTERRKRRTDQGKYLHPEVLGKPRSAAIHQFPKRPKARMRRAHGATREAALA